MASNLKMGIIGSCLSNLTSLFLVSDYGFSRINNAAPPRSDAFVKFFIEENSGMPSAKEMQTLLDMSDEAFEENFGHLAENYREHLGLTQLSRDLPPLHENLKNEKFDVILLDNLFDTDNRLYHYNKNGMDFAFSFPLHLAGPNNVFLHNLHVIDPLDAQESVNNWIDIIKYLKNLQPQAKIIFTACHSCSSRNVPDRAARADTFYELFKEQSRDLDIMLIPPLNVPDDLTKGESDWAHLDMKVYRGVAGFIHTALAAGWAPGMAATGQAATQAPGRARLKPWAPAPSLAEVIGGLLNLQPSDIKEESGMDRTENWDSLKQVEVMTGVEAAFNVRFPFEATMKTSTVSDIRQLLAADGVIARDDAMHVENIFSGVIRRAIEAPQERFAKFVKNGAETELSYHDVASDILAIKDATAGLQPGAIVAIILDHSRHLYSAFMGCTLSGLVPTMLPPLTRKQDPAVFKDGMEVLFSRVKPAAVITTRDLAEHVPGGFDVRRILVEDLQVRPADAASLRAAMPAPARRDELAFLQHSSGTTGHKKGVMLTHAQVLEQCRLYAQTINIKTGDVVASWLPLYHDMGLITSFIVPAIIGCPIVSMDALEWVTRPTSLLDQIETEKAAYAWLPNFAFLHIAKSAPHDRQWDLSSIKSIISCSEPCRVDAFAAFIEKFSAMGCGPEKLGTSYAMAENVFAVSQSAFGLPVKSGTGELSPYLSSGRLLPQVEVEIRDGSSRLGDGQIGEIWLRTSSMFSGYYALPDLSAERIVDGWYSTRDLGAIVDGELYVKGRSDDLIIINGKNVVAHEIEDELNRVDGIARGRILVASRHDAANSSEELIVLAEPMADGDVSDGLEHDLRNRVFSLCGVSPRRVRILPKGFLIKSTSGKISRAKSMEKFEASGL